MAIVPARHRPDPGAGIGAAGGDGGRRGGDGDAEHAGSRQRAKREKVRGLTRGGPARVTTLRDCCRTVAIGH